jgi:hypothetical protein
LRPATRCCSRRPTASSRACPGATARVLDVPPVAGAALPGLD